MTLSLGMERGLERHKNYALLQLTVNMLEREAFFVMIQKAKGQSRRRCDQMYKPSASQCPNSDEKQGIPHECAPRSTILVVSRRSVQFCIDIFGSSQALFLSDMSYYN